MNGHTSHSEVAMRHLSASLLVALCLVATFGLLSSQLVAIEAARGRLDPMAVLALSSALFLLPQIRRYGDRSSGVRRHFDSLGWALAIHTLSIILLAGLGWAGAIAVGAGLLILVHSYLLADSSADGPAALSLGVGLGQVLLALECTESTAPLFLLPAQLTAIALAAVLLQPRSARRQLTASRRATLLGVESLGQIGLRSRVGLSLGLVACPLALVLLRAIPQPSWLGWRMSAANQQRAGDAGAQRSLARDRSRAGVFPTSLSLESDLDPLGGDVRLQVRVSTRDGKPVGKVEGPLLLRGIVLDTFTDEDVTLQNIDDLKLRRDEDDGRRDGWVRLTSGWSNRVVEIEQSDFGLEGRSQALLFQVEPTRAIEAEEVLVHPAGFVTSSGLRSGPLTYRLAWQDRNLTASDLAGHRAAVSEGRYYQLPVQQRVVRELSELARRVTRFARNDFERVRMLTEFFREEFDYSLRGSGFSGLAGILRFLETRQGYCTHFAAASVLLLRAIDIPARVATGFRATEWSDESESYLVRSRDAHAWFEVYFEGVGWVSFDSTAPDRIAEAVQAGLSGQAAESGSWSERLRGELKLWGEKGDPRSSLDGVAGVLLEAPLRAVDSLRRQPLWPGLMIGLVLMGFLVRRFGRRVQQQIPFLATDEMLARGDLERLLRALARRGYTKWPHETLTEFARRLMREPDQPFAGIDRLARWIYRARFGNRPLEEAERAELESFLQSVGRARSNRPPAA